MPETPASPSADPSAPGVPPAHQPLLRGPAVLGSGPDATVPAHYGAPTREQRRFLDGRAVVDLGQLELLEVRGADARTWLTTITSQQLTDLPVGRSAELAVLSPQGRVEHLASAAILADDAILLVTDAGRRAGLRRYLEMMRFAARVELLDRDDLRVLGGVAPVIEILGDGAPAPVGVIADDWPSIAPGGVAYGPDPDDPVGTVLSIVADDDATARAWRVDELAGMAAWEAIRIANHRARLTADVDERTIPHELDLLRQAVHTAKGCYRGQETVAKVLNLGQPPRRLVMLHLDGSRDVLVPAGAQVLMGGPDGRAVGVVTSSALHVDLGPIALAVIKRAVPLDEPLTALVPAPDGGGDGVAVDASQEPIVLPRDHGQRPPTARL